MYTRGGNGVPDARILWSEVEQIWKAGLENSLSPLAYGDKYEI
ncbi:hypothetical protein [Ruminiclostridium herbifermentans]|nr:hypothetical protein [Ruminiclostridium herbifermentans]